MSKSRTGNKPKRKKVSHADKKKVNEAFAKKMHEYNQMTLEELLVIYNERGVAGRYMEALKLVVIAKQKLKIKKQKEDDIIPATGG